MLNERVTALLSCNHAEEEAVDVPDEVEIMDTTDLISKMKAGESPLNDLNHGDCFVGASFILSFIEYWDRNGPDRMLVLQCLSKKHVNGRRLMRYGMLGKLYNMIPESLSYMLELIRCAPQLAGTYMSRDGGIYCLAAFARTDGLIISEILRLICEYVDPQDDILPPIGFPHLGNFSTADVFIILLESEEVPLLKNTLIALANFLSAKRDDLECLALFSKLLPILTKHMDFSERVPFCVEIINYLAPIIPSPELIVDQLTHLLLTETLPGLSNGILITFESIVKYHGIDCFKPETLKAIISCAQQGSYSLKLDTILTVSSLMQKGTTDVHRFLVDSGLMLLLNTIIDGHCDAETMRRALECLFFVAPLVDRDQINDFLANIDLIRYSENEDITEIATIIRNSI